MLTPNEYFALKRRMLLAAEGANFCSSQFLHTYPVVTEAMERNKDDVRALLADCDILRAAHGLELFPRQEIEHASDDSPHAGTTVEPVPAREDEGRSEEVRHDSSESGVAVPARRTNRRRAKRPIPARNRGRKKKDS